MTAVEKKDLAARTGQRNLLIFFIGMAFLVSLLAMVPQLREYTHKSLSPGERIILSSLNTASFADNSKQKILKIQTNKGLFVEFYVTDESGQTSLKQKIKLKDKRDGFFMFNGESSNLVLDDIDGDEIAELLIPSYDENLVAHLSVYSFNKESGNFIKIN